MNASEIARLAALDQRLVAASKEIKLLSRLSWPLELQERFLDDWSRGRRRLPEPTYAGASLLPAMEELRDIATTAAGDEPLHRYLVSTASSYLSAARLINAAGTAEMFEHSKAMYGLPRTSLSGGQLHNLEAAGHFLEVARAYHDQQVSEEAEYCLPAETVKADMERRLAEVFEADRIAVVIDPHLASKAAAGATRVRLRAGTCFSEYDLDQLLNHEAFVHSLTALNGRTQPTFRSLGLGAPRTTGPQEGLATFSELITGSIDMARTERIALRVVAVDMAVQGADFIEVFEFFLESGQPESESFNSAMRVFRGAPLTGGVAFTKDVVYLHGLMEVHTFFRWALRHENLALTRWFFAGRMTIDDVVELQPYFEDGTLQGPRYLPPWMTRTNGLAAYLAFSVFANTIHIDSLHEGHRFDTVEEMEIV